MNVNTIIEQLQALTEEQRAYRVCILVDNTSDVGAISVCHEDRMILLSSSVYVKMSLYRPE